MRAGGWCLVGVAAWVAGCSSTRLLPPDARVDGGVDAASAGRNDGGLDQAPEVATDRPPDLASERRSLDGGRCMVPLAEIVVCPATYAETTSPGFGGPPAQCPTCTRNVFGCPRRGPCESYMVFDLTLGLGSYRCIFDAATGSLVAAVNCGDSTSFCDYQSFCVYGGASVGACETATIGTPMTCPADSGVADAVAGG